MDAVKQVRLSRKLRLSSSDRMRSSENTGSLQRRQNSALPDRGNVLESRERRRAPALIRHIVVEQRQVEVNVERLLISSESSPRSKKLSLRPIRCSRVSLPGIHGGLTPLARWAPIRLGGYAAPEYSVSVSTL